MSKNIRFKGLVATLAQIAADKFAGRIAWASDLARLIYYYTDSNYAVLARKDVAETFAGILASNLTSNRIVTVGANGQLVDDAGLTRTQTNSVTRMVTIGDGLVAESVTLRLNAPATQAVTTIYQIAGSDKWGTGSIANSANLRISNFVDGQLVDWPIVVVDGAGGEITFGGSAATKRDVNLTGNLKLAGIQRISSGGVAALTGMVNSATAGTGIRPKVTLADGTDSAQDAATFRATIGLGSAMNVSNANYGSGYIKFATVTIPGGELALSNLKWSLDGREAVHRLGARSVLTFSIRRSADNSFDARLYITETGNNFTDTITVRTNDGITFDFYIDATSGGWCAYYTITPELNGMPPVTKTFVASASMPTYSTTISASRFGFAHSLVSGRTIGITGDATWTSPAFDGTGNVTAAITVSKIDVSEYSANNTNYSIVWENGARQLYKTAAKLFFNPSTGVLTSAGGFNGNSSSASKLATASTLTIGSTGKAFDGTSNVSWSLAEIGAAQTSHTHAYSTITSIPAAIDAIDGLTPAADRIAYYTGDNAAALAPLSAFGRSLIDDADAATARATIDAAQTSHTHTFASLTSKPTTLSGYGITNGSKIIAKSNATITVNNTTWTDVFSWTSTTYLLGPTTQGLMRSTADMSFSGSVSMQIIRDSTVLYSTTIGATTRFEFKYTDGNDGWMRCIGIMISNSTSSVFYPIVGGDDINQNAEHTWRIQCKGANGINVGGSYVTEAI